MRIVVDASVVLKWHFPAEEYSSNALEIKDDFCTGRILLYAPIILNFEIAHSLSYVQRSGRITPTEAEGLFEEYLKLKIITLESTKLYQLALHISLKEKITVYDASYVALSLFEGIPFYTADTKLLRAATANYPLVKHIAEY